MFPLNILSLLGVGKIWLYAAIAFTLLATLTGAYYLWRSEIESRARAEFNAKQMERTIRDQEEFLRRQQELEAQQREATRALIEQNRTLQSRARSIMETLNSQESAAQDRPASDVLKRTIDQLRDMR